MTQAELEALVRRLEERAGHAPRAYRLRVLALAALGHAYVGAVLLVLLGLGAGLVWLVGSGRGLALQLQVGLPLAAAAALMLRSLWVKPAPPAGFRLKSEAAPRLADCVEQLRRGVGAPRVHEILITTGFDAALAQRPRLGVLGWQKNSLVLGLPFLLACSAQQFRALVGHELGHLSARYGRVGSWIQRTRAAWSRLDEQLARERHWGSFVFRGFFRWYAPRFRAWSFALARAGELEADRAAAHVTSAEDVRDALIAAAVRGRFLRERFWPRVLAGADDAPSPEENPFADLHQQLAEIGEEEARRWLADALAEEATASDTHPCLSDRLAALGMEPALPEPAASAGEALLGPALPGLSARIGEQWCFDAALWWNERYEHVNGARKRQGELRSRARTGMLSPDESWECAQLTEELEGADEALPLYRDLVEEDLEDPRPRLALGRLLLANGDDSGLAHLQGAMELDSDALLPACDLAVAFLARRGRDVEAKPYLERAAQHREPQEPEAPER